MTAKRNTNSTHILTNFLKETKLTLGKQLGTRNITIFYKKYKNNNLIFLNT